MKNKKYLIIGEAIIDILKQYKKEDIYNVGGASLNVSIALSWWNKNNYLITNLTNDAMSKIIVNFFGKHKLKTAGINYFQGNLTTAVVTLNKENDRSFAFNFGDDINNPYTIKEDLFNKSDIIHFGSAFALSFVNTNTEYRNCLTKALENNKIISFDPNYRSDLWKSEKEFAITINEFLLKANIIKLSEEEYEIIFCHQKNTWLKMINNNKQFILVTKGEKGVSFYHNHEVKEIGLESNIKVVDTTGAGDAFIGAILANTIFLENNKIILNEEIIKKACKFASNSVTHLGAIGYFLKNS